LNVLIIGSAPACKECQKPATRSIAPHQGGGDRLQLPPLALAYHGMASDD